MPIKVPDNLPAKETLRKENVFLMDESRAFRQDIRPLKIAILNLMPLKEVTEVQLLRLLGNTALQVEVDLLHMESHVSKNTSREYLAAFYKVFDDIKSYRYDGMIITGAPVELYPFEQVTYWEEMKAILEWTKSNVTSTFHICWGAQAALYYHYGIRKYALPKKLFGIFPHVRKEGGVNLLRGFDDVFFVPQSRYTEIRTEDVAKEERLEVLSWSEAAGLYIAASKDGRQIFVTGHSEYDADTLKNEYERDLKKGDKIDLPHAYFQDDDPSQAVRVRWRSHGNLLFNNWLNYYVYQITPYDLTGREEVRCLQRSFQGRYKK